MINNYQLMIMFASGSKVKVYLGVFSVPRVGHGVRRRQRLVRPHRVCGARWPRLQHDTTSYRSLRSPLSSSQIHRDHCTAPHTAPHTDTNTNRSIHNAVPLQNLTIVYCGTCENPDRKPVIGALAKISWMIDLLYLTNIYYSIWITYMEMSTNMYIISGRIFTQF